ncbi:MAG: prepilin peptidase [Myxococcota bacterium]
MAMIDLSIAVAYAVLMLLLFATGATFGSLLGALIERFPRGMSLWRPRSFCMQCNTQLAWYDLIPLLSFLLLQGRCRHCHTKIQPKLLLLELLCGLLLCLLAARWGNSICTLQLFCLCWLLLAIAYLDAQTGWMPLNLLILLLLSGWGFAALSDMGFDKSSCVLSVNLLQRFAASTAAFAALGAVLLMSTKILQYRKRLQPQQTAMGWGDPLLLAGIAAYVGFLWLPMILFLASLQSVVVHLFYRITQKPWIPQKWHAESDDNQLAEQAIPFGPFLAAATWQTVAIALLWPTLLL